MKLLVQRIACHLRALFQSLWVLSPTPYYSLARASKLIAMLACASITAIETFYRGCYGKFKCAEIR